MLLLLPLLACYQEGILERDFVGTVTLPKAAATRLVPTLDETGAVTGSTEVTDTRLIGPVFIGAYAGIDTTSFPYPHPSMGPILDPAVPGDAFPYGGTTVGRFDFACYDSLACKVVTGRFTDYDDVLEYFRLIGLPVENFDGEEVLYGSTLQQQCYLFYYATSDEEITFIGAEDFTENASGDYEASFTMSHTAFHEGMAIWGYMDAPIIETTTTLNNGTFSTCSTALSTPDYYYSDAYNRGAGVSDALNYPSLSINPGDWVSDGETFVTDPDADIAVNMSFQYIGE